MVVRIVTDSTCDLPGEVIDKLGIRVVPLYINIGRESYLDGVDISAHILHQSSVSIIHTAPRIERFKQLFREC